jgi:hypothetical protein
MHNLILSGYLGLEAGKLGSWEAGKLGGQKAGKLGGQEAGKHGSQKARSLESREAKRLIESSKFSGLLPSLHPSIFVFGLIVFLLSRFPAFSLPGSYFLFIIFSLSLKSSRVRLGPE